MLVSASLASASALPLPKRMQGDAPLAYTVTDLGTIAGAEASSGFFGVAINNDGDVVGRFFGASGQYRGFLVQEGVMVDVGSLGGGVTQALGLNDSGIAVGLSRVASGAEHAFAHRDGAMLDLGTLGGTNSLASAINRDGVIAGSSQRRRGRQQIQHATLWNQGRAVDLGTLGGEFSEGLGINDAGQVVGWSLNASRSQRAFLWTPGRGMIDLGDLGTPTAFATAINAASQVVGKARPASDPFGAEHAFLWRNGAMIDLGVLPEAGRDGPFGPELVNTAATAINDAGQIVGNSYPGSHLPPLRPGPFLWQQGTMRNLNDLIASGSGWTITEANDIDDHGRIVGTALSDAGHVRAVVLSPAPQ